MKPDLAFSVWVNGFVPPRPQRFAWLWALLGWIARNCCAPAPAEAILQSQAAISGVEQEPAPPKACPIGEGLCIAFPVPGLQFLSGPPMPSPQIVGAGRDFIDSLGANKG